MIHNFMDIPEMTFACYGCIRFPSPISCSFLLFKSLGFKIFKPSSSILQIGSQIHTHDTRIQYYNFMWNSCFKEHKASTKSYSKFFHDIYGLEKHLSTEIFSVNALTDPHATCQQERTFTKPQFHLDKKEPYLSA